MPETRSKAALGAGEPSGSSKGENTLTSGKKRKSMSEDRDSKRRSRQSIDTSMLDDCDEESPNVVPSQIKPSYPLYNLLSGKHMDELVVVGSHPSKTRFQPNRGAALMSRSKSTTSSTLHHLMDKFSPNSAEPGSRLKAYSKPDRSQRSMKDVTESNFNDSESSSIIESRPHEGGTQIFQDTKVLHPSYNQATPVGSPRMTELVGTNEKEKGKQKVDEQVASGIEDLDVEDVPQTDIDNQYEYEDEYEFSEHPTPNNVVRYRQQALLLKDPGGALQPVTALFDNCADSNFISRKIITKHKFLERPLLPKHILTYDGLGGAARPDKYVALDIRLPDRENFDRESFRIIDTDNFDLILGASTIQARKILLHVETGGMTWVSIKRKPTQKEAAESEALRKKALETATTLNENMNRSTIKSPKASTSRNPEPPNGTSSSSSKPKPSSSATISGKK